MRSRRCRVSGGHAGSVRALVCSALSCMVLGVAEEGRAQVVGPNAAGCYDPVDFGATPDDPSDDDRPASQSAIDEAAAAGGGRVCFPAGRFRLTRAPAGSRNRFAALSVHDAHIEIVGAGPATTLEVSGDAGGGALYVLSLDPGSSDIGVRDLTIDTSALVNTDEQTHAIQIGSGIGTGLVQDVQLERVRFAHPSSSDGSRKGDCVRLLGNTPESAVSRVTIRGMHFTTCARSGIGIQRNVVDVIIDSNQFVQATDQDIDSEPTGTGQNGSMTITGNVFHDDPAVAQGDFSVTLGGSGGPMSRVTLANNVFHGRGVLSYRSADTIISGNTFDVQYESADAVIDTENVATRVTISGNTIRRNGSAGACISSTHQSGGVPSHLQIVNNTCENATGGHGIDIESGAELTIAGNGIAWSGPAPNAVGVRFRSVIQAGNGLLIANNRFGGGGSAAILLAASPFPIGAVSIVGNLATGTTDSLRCQTGSGGSFTSPIVHAANAWQTAPACAAATLVSQTP